MNLMQNVWLAMLGIAVVATPMAANAEAVTKPEDAKQKQELLERKNMQRREEMFAREKNPEIAMKLGSVLRRFYYRNRMFDAAEQVDRRLYTLKSDNTRAFALGETLLHLQKNQEAATLLAQCEWSETERSGKLLSALADARTGNSERARQTLAQLPSESHTPQERLLAVTVAARLGDVQPAAEGVVKILEQAPARENAALRDYFSGADFETVLKDPAYQSALATKSKAKAHNCAGCPNRGTSRCDSGDDCK